MIVIYLLVLFLVILVVIMLGKQYSVKFFSVRVPVLMYHQISAQSATGLTVLVDELEKQLQYLRKKGYQAIFTKDIGNAAIKKPVLITFDDAYLPQRYLLEPLLIKYGLKAVIFVPLGYLGKTDEWNANGKEQIMTAEELQQLPVHLYELGNHSAKHINYAKSNLQDIEADLELTKEIVAREQLRVSPIFAYPYGAHYKKREDREKLQELFYKYGIRQAYKIGNKLNFLPLKQPYFINRIDVRGTDSLQMFKWKLKFGRIKPF